jgi:hypothetical protein
MRKKRIYKLIALPVTIGLIAIAIITCAKASNSYTFLQLHTTYNFQIDTSIAEAVDNLKSLREKTKEVVHLSSSFGEGEDQKQSSVNNINLMVEDLFDLGISKIVFGNEVKESLRENLHVPESITPHLLLAFLSLVLISLIWLIYFAKF